MVSQKIGTIAFKGTAIQSYFYTLIFWTPFVFIFLETFHEEDFLYKLINQVQIFFYVSHFMEC